MPKAGPSVEREEMRFLAGFLFFFFKKKVEIRIFELNGEFLLPFFGGCGDFFWPVLVVFAHTAAIFGCLRGRL